MKVLITGAAGYLGSQLVRFLHESNKHEIIACDIRDENPFAALESVAYYKMDVRTVEVMQVMRATNVDVVIHLASIVTPGKKSNRAFEYSVDVEGTKNVLEACVATNVKRIIVSSSGAAYGYHPENTDWLTEEHPIRGNEQFAYSHHKRLVEAMLAEYREHSPQLEQTIFRIGTILGANVNNQITNLFEQRFLFGISGSNSPFVFIWDQDVVRCFAYAIESDKTGVYNLAGDGALTIDTLAKRLNKRTLKLPVWLVTSGLYILKRLRLSQYGEEQVIFLRYRPVLLNTKLKNELGFVPQKTSKEVFDFYLASKHSNNHAQTKPSVQS